MIKFILNKEFVSANLPAGMVLADFIRYQEGLTGTKLGCREGDCGACTVLVGTLEAGEVVYESMTSCLTPLGNVEGKHVVTVEGVNLDALNVVQQALADEGGTQCGFCTPGFVMSLCGFALTKQAASRENIILAIAGNICRCTGYKSIERAAEHIAIQLEELKEADRLNWLVDQHFLPPYFLTISKRLESISCAPKVVDWELGTGVVVGGGTDLYVQQAPNMLHKETMHVVHQPILKGIWEEKGCCHIGASTSTEALKQSAIIQRLSPEIPQFFNLISSLQIRNMATVAGNLVNASPIGDLAIFFLALDSSVVLNNKGTLREIALRHFFKAYKTLDKKETELVQEISFALPQDQYYFNFEKVSKRTHLDIASVNTAIYLQCDAMGVVTKAGLAAGGVAPIPKYLVKTSEYFIGKKVSKDLLEHSLVLAQEEISPISDVRGSASYKRLLLRQLMLAHYRKFFPSFFN